MTTGNIIPLDCSVKRGLGDALADRSPRYSEPARKAIEFLKLLDADGRHNLIAIREIELADGRVENEVTGQTFEAQDWSGIAAWIDRHQGQANCYFSANEPKPGAPNAKLRTEHIGAIRAIYADVDPADGLPLDTARLQLAATAEILNAGDTPPTISIDSGSGVQFVWLLADRLDPATFQPWAEGQGRGIANLLSGDAVQDIPRILRLPGTTNLPGKKKRKKGRVARVAEVTHSHPTELYTPARLAKLAPPQTVIDNFENAPQLIADAAAEIDMSVVEDHSSYDDLTLELRQRFETACRNNSSLRALWNGEPSGLTGPDATSSGWRGSLAKRLASSIYPAFGALDYACLAWVWPKLDEDGHDKLDHRQLSRDWGRRAAPDVEHRRQLVADFFEEVAEDAPLFGPEPSSEAPDVFKTLRLDQLLDLPDPKFVVARHLPERSLGFLFGAPGAKKSFLALDWAMHLAFGKTSWHGDDIIAKPAGVVLYLAGEGAHGMKARAEAWMQHHQIPLDQRSAGRFHLLPHSVDLMKPEQVKKLAATLRLGVAQPIVAVVVDTVSRSMPGADENLQKDMTLFVGACDAIKSEFDCLVLGVHHASKSGDMRGSTVLLGAGDFVFRMECKQGHLAGKLHCEKQKDAPDGWSEPYRFEVVHLGDGRSSLVPTRASEINGDVSPERIALILDAMQAAWDARKPWAKSSKAGERCAVRRLAVDFGINADQAETLITFLERTGDIVFDVADAKSKLRGFRVVARNDQGDEDENAFD